MGVRVGGGGTSRCPPISGLTSKICQIVSATLVLHCAERIFVRAAHGKILRGVRAGGATSRCPPPPIWALTAKIYQVVSATTAVLRRKKIR